VLAQRFFEAMRAELEALSPEEVLQLRLDVQKVAAIVMTLAWRDSAPERRAKFERFAAQGNYDISILRRLPSLAQCAWYLRRRQVLAQFAASGAVLSEKESEGAYETRARMIDVIQHWLRDEGDIAVILAQLRQGSGHQVLANDLQTLAELYAREDVVAVIKQDTKHYRASDRIDAQRYARTLVISMGLSKEDEVKRLTDLTQRAATILLRAYAVHRNRGQFLFQDVEDVSVTYPSLYAAARNPPRKRPAEGPVGGEGPADEPAEGPSDGAPDAGV
jgi:hypothetical protein